MKSVKKQNIDIFILARLGSKRLPKKQLKKIDNQYLLKILIDRIKKAKKIRYIVVCTTNKKTDEPLINFLKKEKILYFRGSEKDVLERMLGAAKQFSTDIIIDIEGDKIYTDPKLIDLVVKQFLDLKIEFVIGSRDKTTFDPTDHFIHGIFPAAFKTEILEKICKKKKTKNTETGYKELFFKNRICKKKFITLPSKIEIPKDVRLTIDYPEDLILAKDIFSNLGKDFDYIDIIKLYKNNPQIFEITDKISKQWEINYKDNLIKKSFYA